MLDEPSMGLSPLLVQEIFNIIRNIHKEGMTILLVEQTRRWRFPWPTGPMFWRLAALSWMAPVPSC